MNEYRETAASLPGCFAALAGAFHRIDRDESRPDLQKPGRLPRRLQAWGRKPLFNFRGRLGLPRFSQKLVAPNSGGHSIGLLTQVLGLLNQAIAKRRYLS